MENRKAWYKSKEVWWNVFMTIADFTVILVEMYGALPYFILAQGLVTIILRVWFTKTAIMA